MKRFAFLLLLIMGTCGLRAQSPDEGIPNSVNAATLVGAGRYNIMDTYLSPGSRVNYQGWALRVMDERMRFTRLADGRISRQHILQIDFSSLLNPAGTLREYAGFIDYTLGYHYHFRPAPSLTLLAGGGLHALVGGIYNMQSSNNPGSAKADLDLRLSGLALYRFHIKQLPLLLRLQVQVPFAGILFSPHYGQSYYEIFQLGNSSGIVKFASFHNKWALQTFATIDIPLPRLTIRTGFAGSLYHLKVNGIESHVNSCYFMLGIVKEFITVGGKRSRAGLNYRSAYE